MIEPDYFRSNQQTSFWTSNMFFIACSNFLLYVSTSLLLPVLCNWLLVYWNCSYTEAGVVATLPFIVGLFPLGFLNSYLIDRFKRRNVCLIALILMLSLTLLYPYADSIFNVMALRFAQGVFFGIATMTTGSTLVIDFTASKMRTRSNRTFARFGRLGVVSGIALGIYILRYREFSEIIYLSAILTMASSLLIIFLRIKFRAPLETSKFSLDRFILPAALLPGLNMLFMPFVLGLLIASQTNEFLFITLFVSFILTYQVHKVKGDFMTARQELATGYILSGVGLALLFLVDSLLAPYLGVFLIGVGIAVVSNRFLIMMVSLPLHCGRGSGNNTYQLFWEIGVLGGICIYYICKECCFEYLFYLSLACCIAGLLFYELVIHRWYNKQMEQKY
ncbi:MAG: MFS transporter [Phocaeicola sp.]